MIPEAAVEEVAVRLFDTHEHAWSWEKSAETYRDEARELLEAAAPHMLAEAWKAGVIAGAKMQIKHDEGEKRAVVLNPYEAAK